ncbi:methyltransferase HEMK2 isoform X2 [Lampetra planeri]
MLPTPRWQGGEGRVYEPSEDTFLLMAALEGDAERLRSSRYPSTASDLPGGRLWVRSCLLLCRFHPGLRNELPDHGHQSRCCSLHERHGLAQPSDASADHHRPGSRAPATSLRLRRPPALQSSLRRHGIQRGGAGGRVELMGGRREGSRGRGPTPPARDVAAVALGSVLPRVRAAQRARRGDGVVS